MSAGKPPVETRFRLRLTRGEDAFPKAAIPVSIRFLWLSSSPISLFRESSRPERAFPLRDQKRPDRRVMRKRIVAVATRVRRVSLFLSSRRIDS